MTFGDLQTLTSVWLDDLQFGYFTNAQVKVWLNNAQKEVQKRLVKAHENLFIKCVQTNLVLNQFDYALPQDFKKLNRLEVILSGTTPNEIKAPILPITMNQVDLLPTGTGQASWYYFKQNRLTILPAADTVLPLRMYYSYVVADMVADTDIPDTGIHDEYHELIALLAAQDGFIKDERVPDLLIKKIKEYELDMDADADERNEDVPRSIVETGNSGAYGIMW